jgi:hypothetical protein
MHSYAHTAITLTLASTTLITTGCGGAFSSPEACFNTLRAAAQNNDVPAMMACVTDESQSVLAGGLVMMGSMMKLFGVMAPQGGNEGEGKNPAESIDAVLAKHGVTGDALKGLNPDPESMADAQAIIKLGNLVDDKPAFIADMLAIMERLNQDGFKQGLETQLAGTLKDVKITGNAATATVVTTRGEDQLDFRRTAAGWKIHFDVTQLQASGGGSTPPA